jgi:hypothetical protein
VPLAAGERPRLVQWVAVSAALESVLDAPDGGRVTGAVQGIPARVEGAGGEGAGDEMEEGEDDEDGFVSCGDEEEGEEAQG